MINPRLIKTVGSHRLDERCLSLPGRAFIVERPKVVKFKGLTLDGQERSIKLHDTLAQCVMHEMEHLQGILVDNVAITELTAPAPHA
jgi:peptide deformylase